MQKNISRKCPSRYYKCFIRESIKIDLERLVMTDGVYFIIHYKYISMNNVSLRVKDK